MLEKHISGTNIAIVQFQKIVNFAMHAGVAPALKFSFFLNIGTSIMVIFLKIYTIFFLQQRTLAKTKIQNLNFVFISFNLPKMGKVGFELVNGFFVFACVLCFKRNHCVKNIVLCNKNNQKICFKIDFPPPFHL